MFMTHPDATIILGFNEFGRVWKIIDQGERFYLIALFSQKADAVIMALNQVIRLALKSFHCPGAESRSDQAHLVLFYPEGPFVMTAIQHPIDHLKAPDLPAGPF